MSPGLFPTRAFFNLDVFIGAMYFYTNKQIWLCSSESSLLVTATCQSIKASLKISHESYPPVGYFWRGSSKFSHIWGYSDLEVRLTIMPWPPISLPETPLRIHSLIISTFLPSVLSYSTLSQHRIIFSPIEVQLFCSRLRSASPLGVLRIQFKHDLDFGTAAPSQRLDVGRVYRTWG